jgi:hypothetical protein
MFGLHDTHSQADALPLGCPALGTPPRFSNKFHQVVDQDCVDYTTAADADLAMATCTGAGTTAVFTGSIDQPLSNAGITAPDPINVRRPRLFPEGNGAYIVFDNYDANGDDELAEFQLANGTWQNVGVLALSQWTTTFTLPTYFGTPTRAPNRHIMVAACPDVICNDLVVHELVQKDDRSWIEPGAPYRDVDLGVVQITDAPNLSPDGLRMLLLAEPTVGRSQTFYADRPSIDVRFGPLVLLDTLPENADFLTADCTRLYFSGLGSIFYEPQI